MKLNIGENIRKYRRRLGWTQEQLAEQLGTSVQSVSRWESGGGYPDMELLPSLAQLFAVSVDELLGYEGRETKTDAEDLRKKLFSAVYRENPSVKEVVQLLRQIRMEHPKEAARLTSILYNIPPAKLEHSPEILREMRLILDTCEKQGEVVHTARLIRTLVKYEDEKQFREILNTRFNVHTSEPMNRLTLLIDRAEAQGDTVLFHKLSQRRLAEHLLQFLNDRAMALAVRRNDGAYDYDALPQADAAYAAEISERKLQILHAFNGMCAQEIYPLSANGIADMWTPVRIRSGKNTPLSCPLWGIMTAR